MVPAPPAFDGALSEFFDRYVLPNSPSVERVREFDRRLKSYLARPDPVHPIRYVRCLERGVVCRNDNGLRILPSDNSPVWWIHAFLLSDDSFPKNDAELFEDLPCHMFKLPKGRSYLRSAGYHAAHLIDAKNRDTGWKAWSKDQLRRRTLVNIHPCNMVLVAKTDWRLWGGRSDVLEWVRHRYIERYGNLMTSFLSDVGVKARAGESPKNLHYHYHEKTCPKANIKPEGPKTVSKNGDTLALNRPLIRKNLVGSGFMLDISTEGRRYLVEHDRLFGWVGANTDALKSRSWLEGGLYSWPRPSRKMAAFLKSFAI